MKPSDQFVSMCQEAAQPFLDSAVLKMVLSAIGMSAGFLFGVEFYEFIWIIMILVIIDSATGLWGAKLFGEVITSRKFIVSVPKLLRYLVFIVAGHLLQQVVPIQMYIENVVIIFLATTEFISIAENLGKAGMPIPKQLLNSIEKLRDKQ